MPLTSLVLTTVPDVPRREALVDALGQTEGVDTGPWTHGRLPVVVECDDVSHHRALLELLVRHPAVTDVQVVLADFSDVSTLPSADKRFIRPERSAPDAHGGT